MQNIYKKFILIYNFIFSLILPFKTLLPLLMVCLIKFSENKKSNDEKNIDLNLILIEILLSEAFVKLLKSSSTWTRYRVIVYTCTIKRFYYKF
jgi:hypothetical protein